MNSFKVLLAALMLGAFSLTVTGCPGKKEEAPAAEAMDEAGDSMEEATDEAAEATDEMVEEVQ